MPAPKGHGRPRTHNLREILNAVFYLLKSGCQWRLLPHDFPRDGLPSTGTSGNGVSTALGKGSIGPSANSCGFALGRDPQPSAGVVDSQSAKSTAVGGEERGYEGEHKIKKRKGRDPLEPRPDSILSSTSDGS